MQNYPHIWKHRDAYYKKEHSEQGCHSLQNSIHWTQKLPSIAIMGLILITSLLIFILILDASRKQISIHLKHNRTIKPDKKETQEPAQLWNTAKTGESDSLRNTSGLTIENEEKKPPEYETILNNDEENKLRTEEVKNHQIEQEIKDLQETSEEYLNRNSNTLPSQAKLTETVNFLRKGRNVADTL